ncbi:MAG TPA: hypothetical protein VID04_03285 [Methylomirabilota bacterium]|jgi:hypothetical protein
MILTIRLAKLLGIVTAIAAVLSVPAASVSGGPPGGLKVFVISGKGNTSFSNSSSSSGIAGDCNKARLIVVSASISSGAAPNTVTAEARCGDTVVADTTAVELGGGTVAFEHDVEPLDPSTPGVPSCLRIYAEPDPGAGSNWTVTCVFLFP